MTDTVSEKEIRDALEAVRHPEINNTLAELGMIKDIAIGENKAVITMALPFMGIPIRDYLVNSVRKPVEKLGMEVEVSLTEMNPQERAAFLTKAQQNWIG